MTNENRRSNILQALALGDEAMVAARLLLDANQPRSAVGRAYYAAVHYAEALLLTEGLQARTHRGVSSFIYLHFVSEDALSAELAGSLGRMARAREQSDYVAEVTFTESMALESTELARAFQEAVRKLLGRQGWPNSAA